MNRMRITADNRTEIIRRAVSSWLTDCETLMTMCLETDSPNRPASWATVRNDKIETAAAEVLGEARYLNATTAQIRALYSQADYTAQKTASGIVRYVKPAWAVEWVRRIRAAQEV